MCGKNNVFFKNKVYKNYFILLKRILIIYVDERRFNMETFFWSFGGSIIGFLIGLLVRNWIEKKKRKNRK